MTWGAGALLLVFLLLAALIATWRRAEATDYYSGYRWAHGLVFWYSIDGYHEPPSSWMPVIEDASNDWNFANSAFFLTHGGPAGDYGAGYVFYAPFSTWTYPYYPDKWGETRYGLGPIGPGGVRYLVSPAWMSFDSEKQWRLDNQGDFHSVGNVRAAALHEFGHWISLDHTNEWSIMCSDCMMHHAKKTLSGRDIQAVREVYPTAGGGSK